MSTLFFVVGAACLVSSIALMNPVLLFVACVWVTAGIIAIPARGQRQ